MDHLALRTLKLTAPKLSLISKFMVSFLKKQIQIRGLHVFVNTGSSSYHNVNKLSKHQAPAITEDYTLRSAILEFQGDS